jgi:endonuclease V-like protein UPF0215 family
MLKREIRIIGFDDGPFEPSSKLKVPVVGTIFRGGIFLDGMLRTDVTVDGTDSTERIESLINGSRHKKQLKVIMFDGITFAGFNIVDIARVHESIKLPILVINRKRPDMEGVRYALKRFEDFDERWKVIERAGEVKECGNGNGGKIFYQSIGLKDVEAEEIIGMSCTRSQIPEPLRVAHLIATAIVRGESFGRA